MLRRGRTSASPPPLCSPSRGRPGARGAGVSTGASGQAPTGGGAWGFRTMGSGQPAAAARTIAMSRTLFMASWARRDVRGVSIVGAIRPDPLWSSVPQRRCSGGDSTPSPRVSAPLSALSTRERQRKTLGVALGAGGARRRRRPALCYPGGTTRWPRKMEKRWFRGISRCGMGRKSTAKTRIAIGWSNLLEPRAGCPQSLHAVTSKSSGAYCRTRLCIICFLCTPSLPWRS